MTPGSPAITVPRTAIASSTPSGVDAQIAANCIASEERLGREADTLEQVERPDDS